MVLGPKLRSGRKWSRNIYKTTRITCYFDIAARTRTFLQGFRNIMKFMKFLKNNGISRNPEKFLEIAEFPEKCGSGPPPRPQLTANTRRFLDPGSAPLPRARSLGPGATGIRPRADGNPAPSRQKSCPDPDPLPPFFKLTLLTSRSGGRCAPPLTPICSYLFVVFVFVMFVSDFVLFVCYYFL